MIFTSLSPNTQRDDFLLALKTILKPGEYFEGEYIGKVKKWFKDFFGVFHVSVYESARSGLYFVLKELGIKEGDEVLLQAFTCVAAVNPVKWTGARPVFVDINPKDFNMDIDDLENKVNEKTKAIIVQHTFGYPAKVNEIKEIVGRKGIYIIEDCAHTIGTEYMGKKLGLWGDAGVFSLGRDKAVSASFGGVVITNRKFGKNLEEKEKFLSFPQKKWVKKQILYTIVAFLTRTLYEVLFIGKLVHYIATRWNLVEKATTEEEKKEGEMPDNARSKLPNAFARLAFNQLRKIGILNKKRRDLSHLYVKRLSKIGLEEVKLPEWKIGEHFYPLRFPLLVKRRDELLKFAQERGMLLGDWYDVPIAPKQVDQVKTGYKQGSCVYAEKVCESILNLPLHSDLTEEDALKVIAVIRDFYL
ncbi:aminotransferase class I/II-fold pyridoxal phosphate-dependent enzyme [Candidatus Dojkabacteria bacterium]|nr:aminotransferase class I/II-fold pyridoxal phosphate-dependent enzyme [Candidatus Dojkabacteria bacterium]